MLTRTVRAENMLTALEVIKKELGPDALVVSVRQIMSGPSWQVWRKPLVEVVAVRLAEGEKPEQMQTAISQQQARPSAVNNPEEVEEMFPEGSAPMPIDSMPGIFSVDKDNKRPSPFIKNFQPPVVKKEEETDGPAALPVQAVEPPSEPDIKTETRNKKEISKPVFEHILTDTSKKVFELEKPPEENNTYLDIASRPPSSKNKDVSAILNYPPMVLKTYQHLLRQGLDEGLLQNAARMCVDTLNARVIQERSRVWECMQKQLETGLRIQSEAVGMMSRVIFLTGTSGVGKTSSLAKLAVHLSATHGRKVGWICADTVRIGAIVEARTYAETIGVPLQAVYTADELQKAINVFLDEVEFILVDTPAFNPRNEQSVVELGELLTAYPRRCTWVVVPATAKESDLQNTLATIGPFKPRGLVVTKLDETNNFSEIFNISWRSQLPLTYFTFGSRVINDLMPARSDLLVKAIFDERFTS